MAFLFLGKSTQEDGWREALEVMRNFIGSNYDNSHLSSTFYMSHVVLEVQIHEHNPSAH